jgi:hypothetical protein
MCLFEDAMRIFGYVDGADEGVLAIRCRRERVGDGIDFRGFGGRVFRRLIGFVRRRVVRGWLG